MTRRLGLGLSVALAACTEDRPPTDAELAADPITDPASCEECHPDHYRQWLGSMHAYAAEDPVFRAMNARGQRETGGELGSFCVKCHAPLAVEFGLTVDGLNLDDVPKKLQGVTCYFCHTVDAVEGTHNNPLRIARDRTMRGNLQDPVESAFHESAYSPLLDGRTLASGDACGTCHDIVTPAGVELERTHAEWLYSFYSEPDPLQPQFPDTMSFGQTCANCHMNGSVGLRPIADAPGVRGDRIFHEHLFPGVDVALTDFPSPELAAELRAEQRAAIDVQRVSVVCGSICLDEKEGGGYGLSLWLHNEFAGHDWPSGATQDRRAWVELRVRDGADAIVLESGIVADREAVAEVDDPNLWLLRDRMLDAGGAEVHMFWEARSYESEQLPVADSFFGDPHTWQRREYPDLAELPARVEVRLLLRPMDYDVLDGLVESGDLDPVVIDRLETFSVPSMELTWTPETAIESNTGHGLCIDSAPQCGSPFLQCQRLRREEVCMLEAACAWDPTLPRDNCQPVG